MTALEIAERVGLYGSGADDLAFLIEQDRAGQRAEVTFLGFRITRNNTVRQCADAVMALVNTSVWIDADEARDAILAVATPPEPKPWGEARIRGDQKQRDLAAVDKVMEQYSDSLVARHKVARDIKQAIFATGAPPESPRERLGRVLYCAIHSDGTRLWECLTADNRERHYVAAEAVIAEKACIDAEVKG